VTADYLSTVSRDLNRLRTESDLTRQGFGLVYIWALLTLRILSLLILFVSFVSRPIS